MPLESHPLLTEASQPEIKRAVEKLAELASLSARIRSSDLKTVEEFRTILGLARNDRFCAVAPSNHVLACKMSPDILVSKMSKIKIPTKQEGRLSRPWIPVPTPAQGIWLSRCIEPCDLPMETLFPAEAAQWTLQGPIGMPAYRHEPNERYSMLPTRRRLHFGTIALHKIRIVPIAELGDYAQKLSADCQPRLATSRSD